MQDVLVLRIFDGGAPRLVRVTGFPAAIGRSVFGDVPIEADGLSLRHAVVERRAEGYLLRDNASRNGVIVAGVAVKEHLFRANGTALLGGVRVDFVLADDAETTGPARLLAPAEEWDPRRIVATVGAVLALYLVVCVVEAFKQFGDFWPPERPSEIFTDAVAVFAGMAAVSFFAAVWSKLNTRRFHYLRFLGVVTGIVAWYLLFDELGDMITYNLWTPSLRAVVPPLILLLGAAGGLALLLRPLFPAWRRSRLVVSALVVCGVGFGLDALRDHYRFQESDQRAAPVAFGLPLGDPRRGAKGTDEVVGQMMRSVEAVQGEQRRVREEIEEDKL